MPKAPDARYLACAYVVLGLLLTLGCRGAGAERIVGPDGSAMLHVHCGAEQAVCFRLAGQACPTGYELTPVMAGRDGNFLVRCRERLATPPTVAAACAPSSPPASAALAAPAPREAPAPQRASESWPPAAEPWPAAYPWPPPEASSVGGVQAPPSAQEREGGQVDLGY